ncbi:hypothetical protein [Bacillus salipaludis]|uniref:Uncharacterized protein n=1 Tax=Bacillus salipaludis TaxID=2547811 RepID=A0ABW8RNQ9_9BACI
MKSSFAGVVFPNDLLEGLSILTVIRNPIDKNTGVAALTCVNEGMHELRLYHLRRREDQNFFLTHEIEAFAFRSRKDLNQFLDRLPF